MPCAPSSESPEPMEAVHAAIAIKTLFVKGQIIEGTNTTIKGQGTAEVILANGKAIVHFTAKISTAGSETNVFSWGLSRTALKTLNSNVPTITPTTGGSGKFYSSAGTVDSSSTGFGACFQSSTSYWTPARLHDTSGNTGAWPSSMFPVDSMITGTVCGSY